ncbi:MAG: T9SS type A sorting domain-containing protein, partial [Ferruginibacter sp.]
NITHTSANSNNPNVALTGNVVPLIPLTYVWVGLNGDWQVATNWAPPRLFPATNDSLLFTSASINDVITNVPTQTVGYIGASLLTGTTLQASASGNTLTIGNLTGADFFVEAGSSFNINTVNALTLNLVTGATASVNGSMTYTAGGHKISAADAGAIVFNSGAVFTAGTGFTGNAFGTVTANSAIFSSGSVYRHISGGNPFVLTQPASVVVFQTGSLYKQESILTPSVSGRTYANFEVVAPSLFPISASGANLLKMDNLTVTNGSISFSMTGGFDLKGNVSVAAGDTLRFSPASAAELTLNGTTAQSITNAGTLSFSANQNVTINNAAGITLNSPVTLLGTLTFTSGLVNTTATNLLTMAAGSAVTGASNASFVTGPVKKIGNTPFVFPVGKSGFGYAAAEITNFTGGAITDEFTAEYLRGNARLLGPVTAVGLHHVSACDYWRLDQNFGTSTVDITLYWSPINVCTGPYVNNLATLTVAHFDGISWDAYGTAGMTSGTITTGTVTWGIPQSTTFGLFSLASIATDNPLPITINYFTGTKQNANHLLNWQVTCASTPSVTIELERSTDGRNYNSIYSIFATAIRCQQPFNYSDNQPATGVNYYRLKMTDADGKITYSSIVSLINAVKGMEVMNIAPNPIVNGSFNLKMSAAEKMQMELVITDMQGRILHKQSVSMSAGFNSIPVNVSKLAAGTYQLFGNTGEGRTRVLRFVIQ